LEEVKVSYTNELLSYDPAKFLSDTKKDLDNINRGRVDIINLLVRIGQDLQEMKDREKAESAPEQAPKVPNEGGY
jgi:hypothetical protein